MDYSKFITKKAQRRRGNLIRKIAEVSLRNTKAITMAGGMPNVSTFPFQEIDVTYKDGTQHQLTGDDLKKALQYNMTDGYPPLKKLWKEYQDRWHSPKRDDFEFVVTTGSQEGMSKLFELFIDEGDPVMVQVPMYTGTLIAIHSLAPEFIGIEQDTEGIVPEKIQEICEAREKAGLRQPKLLCINPTGSNPTGSVLTEERRRQTYALAQKYDFLILEDDAYYFINFLDYKPTSFLSLDTDGRVIRLDSLSKIISAGIRIGIVTAHKYIAEQIVRHISCSTLHASSLAQVLVYKLLSSWGPDKFDQHLNQVCNYYREKRDMMVSLAEKHLGGLAEWGEPKGGMFLWIKITAVDNVFDLVMEEFMDNGVLVLPGHAFNYDSEIPDQHVRLSYSNASSEDVDKGLSIIADLIRKKMKKTDNCCIRN